jgi:hypothetical protein
MSKYIERRKRSRWINGATTVFIGTVAVILPAIIIGMYSFLNTNTKQEALQDERDTFMLKKCVEIQADMKNQESQIQFLKYSITEINVKLNHIVKQQDRILEKLYPVANKYVNLINPK